MESACVPPYNLPKYCRDVYEPAEDSYLLLDALRKERSFLEILHPTICVEIGYVVQKLLKKEMITL